MTEIFDYLPEVKKFIETNFAIGTPDDKNVWTATLPEIHQIIIEVLPADAVTQTMIYETLKNLGFYPRFYQNSFKYFLKRI